jgi:type I restriction enzyme, S subunit
VTAVAARSGVRQESGVGWLGAIPEHWEVARLKYVAKLGTGHTPSRQVRAYWENCTIQWVTLADVWQLRDGRRTTITETAEKISKLGLANSAAVLHPAGTVILSRTASVGFSAILGVDAATSQDFMAWTCGPRLEPGYLLYLLRAMKQEFRRLVMGSTHSTIYMPDIEVLTVPLPPIAEQRAITTWLGRELAALDDVVAREERLLRLFNERRSALIASRLRALSRDVRLGTCGSWLSGGTPPKDDLTLWDGDVPWATSKDLGVYELSDTVDHITEVAARQYTRSVPAGALLIATRGMALAKRLPLAMTTRAMAFNQDLKALVCGDRVRPKFLLYVLRGLEAEILALTDEAAHGTKRLETGRLRRLQVPLPPMSKQDQLVATLDGELKQTDMLRSKLEQQLSLLAEHRQALIFSAVTGRLGDDIDGD